MPIASAPAAVCKNSRLFRLFTFHAPLLCLPHKNTLPRYPHLAVRVNLNLQRYTKLLQQREYRLEWAEKIGMGFELPKRSTGQLLQFRNTG
jgi:hypothetical protein